MHAMSNGRARRMVKMLGVAGVSAAMLTGCNNAGQGALSGAALGALGGMAIGSMSGNMGEGAAIGAAGGAIGGAVLGDQNRRRDNRRYDKY